MGMTNVKALNAKHMNVGKMYVFDLLADLHEQRLKKLRDLTKTISEDDWMYPSADKLLGLK